MPVRVIESKQNARLKELRRALAQPGGPLAGIEGPHLLAEALRAGLRMECVFAAKGCEALLDALALPPETEILLAPRELLASALTTETPQLIAALVRPPAWSWDDLLSGRAPLIVVLAGLQDPGNLGTILRSAEAFGAAGVVCLPGTVSAWNPKAVRASAGSLFRVPVLEAKAAECFLFLRQASVKIFTTAPEAPLAARSADLTGGVAILIGNEGSGVPEALASEADDALTIPCPGKVESLNAAVALSVLLYEAAEQRDGWRSAQ